MKTTLYSSSVLCLAVLGGCALLQASEPLPSDMEPEEIKSVMANVADWQLANPSRHHPTEWHQAAFYAGLTAWAQMAESPKYYEALIDIGDKNDWQPHRRIYHADDHAVGQMYLEMYRKYKDPKMIDGIQNRFDHILANPSPVGLAFGKKYDIPSVSHLDRWNWCDALFMAPPVLAKLARTTGDGRYLEFMNQEWWATTDYLYDKEEHLYYRDDRFFDRREANGEKIFWSRGNGWVFAGLSRVLEEMPADYPDRDRYVQLYKEMAAKIVAIQPEDGMWRASLLDPDSYPTRETSGTGFYTYGLAWGVNHGYLDERTYLPAILKAWQGLVDCVHPDGKLGYVQPVGADPRQVSADQTEVYGVGAFLLAGSEVYQLAIRQGVPAKKITAVNPLIQFRDAATLSIDWKDVQSLRGVTADNVGVFDFRHNRFLVTQAVDNNSDGKVDKLLFQMDMAPGDVQYAWLMKRPNGIAAPTTDSPAFGRFVPERKDDYAWENDKIAFRMYGKALETELVSVGIDAWGKRVTYPIIDKWYQHGDYHNDHGEGLDFYAVGKTLGCGGMAPIKEGKLYPSRNFRSSKTIATGPIRTIFELTYEPWDAAGVTVSHIKRVSLDRGSNLNRFESRIRGDGANRISLAAGVVVRNTGGIKKINDREGWLAYWEPADLKHGRMGCGLLFEDPAAIHMTEQAGHLLGISEQSCREPFVYYGGACWDKVEAFDNVDKWTAYLNAFARELKNPVNLTVK